MMHELRRIVLVDWYLLPPQDIDVIGNIGLFGGNGSGKSTIVDAIQVVLTGASPSYTALNVSADDRKKRSGRSIKDYCLGMVSDRKEGGIPDRDCSYTRIALVFENKITGERNSIGVALYAENGQEKHIVESRFIAAGTDLSQADFVIWNNESYQPIPWSSAKKNIENKAKKNGFEEFPTVERYVSVFLKLLSIGNYHPNEKQFLRNLKNSVAFRPIDNPTEFVRRYILDHRPVEVQEFRNSVAIYEEIKGKIEQLEQQEDFLKQINKMLRGFMRYTDTTLLHEYLEVAAYHIHHKNISKETWKLEQIESDLEEKKDSEHINVSNEIISVNNQLRALEIELSNNSTYIKIKNKELQISGLKTDQAQKLKDIESAWSYFERSINILDFSQAIGDQEIIDALWQWKNLYLQAKGSHDFLISWIALFDDLARINLPTSKINMLSKRAQGQLQTETSKLAQIQESLELKQQQIKALENTGEIPLGAQTKRLFEQLRGIGLHPSHLCSAVKISNPDWQDAIEAILGKFREAILVPVEEVPIAIKYLRQNREHFYGCLIYKGARGERDIPNAQKNSLASFVETEDINARALINTKLGKVIAVDSEQELLREKRAATKDCIFFDGVVIQARKPYGTNILGTAPEEIKTSLLRERAHFNDQAIQAEKTCSFLDNFVSRLKTLEYFLSNTIKELSVQKLDFERKSLEIKEVDESIAQISAKLPRNVTQKIDELKKSLREELLPAETRLRKEAEQSKLKRTRYNERRLEYDKGRKKYLFKRRTAFRKLRREVFFIETPNIKDELQRLFDEFGDYEKVGIETNKTALDQRKRATPAWNQTVSKVREYSMIFRRRYDEIDLNEPSSDNGKRLDEWLSNETDFVVNHELREYKNQAALAREEMQRILQEDFLSRLVEQFNKVKDTLRELNTHLKERPFNEEIYKFVSQPNPELEEIYRLAKEMENRPEILGPLFAAASDKKGLETDDLAKAVQKVQELLTNQQVNVEFFEDYRQYLNFEVQVLDSLTGAVKTTLSARQETGSGGERQIPFYVAIAASLASMYHGRISVHSKTTRGLSLALFDEAFNKLDSQNMGNCMNFFHSLGLQVLLAAPDEKRKDFVDKIDTVVDIFRDKSTNFVLIDVSHPGPRLKELIRKENPDYKGIQFYRQSIFEATN